VKVAGAIPAALAAVACRYLENKAKNATGEEADTQVPGTYAQYSDPLMESLLEELLPTVEAVVGKPLFPTYAYCRLYKRGDVLKRHRDRPCCEFSVTLCLGSRGDDGAPAVWPIFMDGTPVACAAGDMAIYRGFDVEHWREEFAGQSQAQVFLHYVDRAQPYSELLRYDGRDGLACLRREKSAKRVKLGEMTFRKIHRGRSMLGSRKDKS
jgi:hypothetical protein